MEQEISNAYQTRKGLDKLNIWMLFTFAMMFWAATVGLLLANAIERSFLGTFTPFVIIPVATYCTITCWSLFKKYRVRYG